MIELQKGSERLIPMEVTRKSDADFDIDGVLVEVYNTAGDVVESGVGIFDEHVIYYFLDTDQAEYEVGKIYTVCYSVTIVGMYKVIKGARRIKIVSCY